MSTAFVMGSSPGELSEELVTKKKRKKGWRMSCDVGKDTMEGLSFIVLHINNNNNIILTFFFKCEVFCYMPTFMVSS